MQTGRPPKYNTAKKLQEAIDDYFDNIVSDDVPITITGLCLHLGFCDRRSFYDLEKQAKFSYTIKTARQRIENSYEKNLHSNAVAGSIFALKNFGWSDKQEHELTGKDGGPIIYHGMSDDELRELITRGA